MRATSRHIIHQALAWSMALLLMSAPVAASDRGHGYRGYGHHDYSPHYDRHHYRNKHGYRHQRHRDHGREGAYLLGGLVIGSLITHAYHSRPSYEVAAAPPRYYEAPIARRLYRDLDGDCFERQIDDRGREILISLPYNSCNW